MTAAQTMQALWEKGTALREQRLLFVQAYNACVRAVEAADVPATRTPLLPLGYVVGAVASTAIIRQYAGPLETASERLRDALLELEPVWPAAVQLAYYPQQNGLTEKQAEQVQGWCQFTSGEINQARTLLDLYYASRWYNDSPRRVPRFAAYTYRALTTGGQAAVDGVYRAAVGPEYIAEQEETRRVQEELEQSGSGFSLTSAGGLILGLGAGLLGVWILRRKK